MTPQLALLGCAHIHTPGFIKTVMARTDVKVKSVWDHDAPRAGSAPMSCRRAVLRRPRGRSSPTRRSPA